MTAPQVPNRQQYAYPTPAPPAATPIRFVDGNPRPSKSPRHAAPPELPSNTYAEYGARFAPPYNGNTSAMATRTNEYFPTTMPMQAWTTGPDTSVVYGTATQPLQGPNAQHYEFPSEHYVKEESNPQQHYTWNPS
jgi:hypothetical protein